MLAALATETRPKDLEDGEDKAKASFWEIPYVEVLQLSLANLKGALNLQCRFATRLNCQLIRRRSGVLLAI